MLLELVAFATISFVLVVLVLVWLPPRDTKIFVQTNDVRRHIPSVNVARPDDESIAEIFLRRVEASGSQGAYFEKHPQTGKWQKTTWNEFLERSEKIAGGLVSLGLVAGDKVSVLGRTCGRWCEIDGGIHLAGCIGIGIFPKQSVEQLAYQLEHSDTRVVFVESAAEVEDIIAASEHCEKLIAIVPWDDAIAAKYQDRTRGPAIIPYSKFQEHKIDTNERDARLLLNRGESTAIIVYTSGTTGHPKGVMISHRSLIAFATCRGEPFFPFEDDLVYSFLPMAHVAERVLSFYARIAYGNATAFASSMRAIMREVDEVRPTIFGSVPRIFEKAHGRIYAELGKIWGASAFFSFVMSFGLAYTRKKLANQPIPLWLRVANALADLFVYQLIRRVFLGGRVNKFVTGAAPLSVHILEFFWALNLQIYEVYGMSEATGITHCNTDREWRLGSVGKALPGVETMIAADGEILVSCPWTFSGYYKNEEATRETFQGKWLCTGDIGRIDQDGYLYITDRKKHLIITSGGKNLSPAEIEAKVKFEDPAISQVHAHGDRRPYITVMIAPGPLETLEWGASHGLVTQDLVRHHLRELLADPTARSEQLERDMAPITRHPDFILQIKSAVERANKRLMQVEKIKAFFVLSRDLSQEHGEMTATMKPKRKELERMYANEFDRLYTDRSFGVHFPMEAE